MSVPAIGGPGRGLPTIPQQRTPGFEGASTAGASDDDARPDRQVSALSGGTSRVTAGTETYAQALSRALATVAARRAAVVPLSTETTAARVRPEDSYVAYQLTHASASGAGRVSASGVGAVEVDYGSAAESSVAPTRLDTLA